MDQVGNALQSYMRFQSQEEPEGLSMAMLLCCMLCPELAKSSAAKFLLVLEPGQTFLPGNS